MLALYFLLFLERANKATILLKINKVAIPLEFI